MIVVPVLINELPRIGVMEYRAGDGPGDDDEYCEQKSNRPPRLTGGSDRDVGEYVLHLSRTRAQETLFPTHLSRQSLESGAFAGCIRRA